jgi:hypothetical protein
MDLPTFLLYLHHGAWSCCRTIFDHLSLRDIHSLRLTTKRIEQVASTYYFPFSRVYISSHAADLAAFTAITSNPRLAAQVEEIVWDDTTFNPSLLDFNVFKSLAVQYPAVYGQELRKSFDVFRKLASEHIIIRDEERDFEALVGALPRLPALKRIVLTRLCFNDEGCDLDSRRGCRASGKAMARSSPAMRQWRAIPHCQRTWMPVPDVHWTWVELESYRNADPVAVEDTFDPKYAHAAINPRMYMGAEPVTEYWYDDVWGLNYDIDNNYYNDDITPFDESTGPAPVYAPFRGLILLLRALEQTHTTRIEELRIINPYDTYEGMPSHLFSSANPALPLLRHTFQSLRHLALAIDFDNKFAAQIQEQQRPGHDNTFTTTLAAAQQLRSLELRVHNHNWGTFAASLRLSNRRMAVHLPRLQYVTIIGGGSSSSRRGETKSFEPQHFHDLLSWCESLVTPRRLAGGSSEAIDEDYQGRQSDHNQHRLRCLRIEKVSLVKNNSHVHESGNDNSDNETARETTWATILAELKRKNNSSNSRNSNGPDQQNQDNLFLSLWLDRLELINVTDAEEAAIADAVSTTEQEPQQQQAGSENENMDQPEPNASHRNATRNSSPIKKEESTWSSYGDSIMAYLLDENRQGAITPLRKITKSIQ